MTNPDNVGGLPELPRPEVIDMHFPTGVKIYGYTREQMRAYGELCRAAPAGSGEVEALVKLWRDRAAREDEDGNPYETQQSEMRLRLCADELEALLRKLQQGAE